ncbi:MAG TPA: carbamoyltransferase N-terminal domain-containing protein [Thermoanaerobaculia bacterium]|nr:carbamoyltransferase N-terminal domain-containing protein [Thermoanaerobaculia bacterium]
MNVLGLSAFFHESACCLLRDGRLVAAAEEERFSRVKHDPRLPVSAFRWCLKKGGIGLLDLDAVAFYESPVAKVSRQLWAGAAADLLDPERPEREIREGLGWDGPILTFPHHLSHAASAFFCSGFPAAAVLTVDGVGEWDTTTYSRAGRAGGASIDVLESVSFPHSLGLLYSTLTAYLGFAVNDGEYKVMGLAPYGEPRFLNEMRRLVASGPGGQFRLDLRYFDFISGRTMYSPALVDLFGQPPRPRAAEIGRFHQDVARSLQLVLEEILIEKTRWLHDQTGLPDLCMAGGVALNCVANGRILREGPFRRLFVQPAAGDSGGCVGAAALAHVELTGERPGIGANFASASAHPRPSSPQPSSPDPAHPPSPGEEGEQPDRSGRVPLSRGGGWGGRERGRGEGLGRADAGAKLTPMERPGEALRHVYLGPSSTADEVSRLLDAAELPGLDFRHRETDLLEAVVDRLEARKVVAWFHGALELGPRALGARSLLADPRDPEMRDRLNRLVKKREAFRPFAPSVLAGHAAAHFDLGDPGHPSPFMLETCQVISPLDLPAVTHVDGSARPQTVDSAVAPRFAALLEAFHRRTGCPLLVNTSFNVRGEPIVASPVDALLCFASTGIDTLVLEDFVIDRDRLPPEWADLIPAWRQRSRSGFARQPSAVSEDLYTFV